MKYRLFNPTTGAGCEVRNAADRDIQLAAMGEGTTVTELPDDPVVEVDPAAKLAADKAFGQSLVDQFLAASKEANLGLATSRILMGWLKETMDYLTIGSIGVAREALGEVVAHEQLFPQAAKDAYLAQIDGYLNSQSS